MPTEIPPQQLRAQATPESKEDQSQDLGSENPSASGSKTPAPCDEASEDDGHDETADGNDDDEDDGSENGEGGSDDPSDHEPLGDEAASDPESEQPINHESDSDSETTLILGEVRTKDVAPTDSDSGSSSADESPKSAEDLSTPQKEPEWREDLFTSPYNMGNSGPAKREILETCIELMQFFGDNYPEIRMYLG